MNDRAAANAPRARTTLPILLAEWARIVDRLEHHAQEPAHVFTDDVLVRHAIALQIREKPTTAELREMLTELDAHFRAFTSESTQCVLGADDAEREGWSRSREWYFWRAPRDTVTAT